MQNDSTPKKYPSREQKRNARLARGLPAYTEYGAARARERSRQSRIRCYTANRKLIDDIKLARGCTDCGYCGHPAALHFDHLPGYEKKNTLARLVMWKTQAVILAEIEKCEVVCANCHAIRTAARRGPTSSNSPASPPALRTTGGQERLITFQGRTLTLGEWSRETGISRGTISARINRHGWSVEQSLTEPVHHGGPRPRKK